ncbi:hypothetical protein AB0C93_02620 [Streptomyces sp. NPDC048518]|uniref:hypothetical protein n=1 Tax=Streptomyces sp. NPDC048518 TaxID=3155029 RepID=UPI00340BCE84
MNRLKYVSTAGLVALAGLAAGALFLGPAPDTAAAATRPAAYAAAPTTPPPAAPGPSLTANVSASSVRSAEEFRIHGEARGLPAGTPVTLQQRQGALWVTLPATVDTTPRGTYSMRVRLAYQGRNALRMSAGETLSPVVYVTVLP